MKPSYKTSRKYKCPYCDFSATRGDLVEHVDKKHQDLIPEGYTAARAVYDSVNKKNFGICMICKKKVYAWNDKVNRYRNLCEDPKCKAKVRENALERHIRVYNKPTLLNDAEQQEKMLANRRISGTYTFSDGTKMTYTGKYERNALEFMDKVLNIPAMDIQAPGPVLEYEYDGEVHKWITDIYYIPANLLIEIKDGGSNPNNRSMPSYREKQVAKETMVTSLGTFNYVRLTNNNFAQLLDVLADIKNGALEMENPKMKIHINEEVGGLPKHGPPEAYIIPYGMNNAFTGSPGLAYSNSEMDKILTFDSENNLIPMDKEEFTSVYGESQIVLYATGNDVADKIAKTYQLIKEEANIGRFTFAEIFADRKINRWQDVLLSSSLRYYDNNRESAVCKLIENATVLDSDTNNVANIIDTKGNIKICQSPKGYYAYTSGAFNMASEYFQDIETLNTSGVIDLMQDIYDSNTVNGGEDNDIE